MSTIDNRVVQMQFDNNQFEKGIHTSVKSLETLKNGLNLEGAGKGLTNLQKVSNSFSMSGLTEGIDRLSSKFSALSIIGITALANITNSALNAGKRLVSSLTIDPIKMGLQEYETKMGAIQTILTNTASNGTTLKDVNATLNDLNEYSDKTIYNFAEMAKNIGTFTAAGVGLKESAVAIKGIANLAAGSGSTSMQASSAMYQLSQALSSGTVKLQDWNSVVNSGMGGQLFQKALEKTAKELGHGRDMSVSFRDSLEKGWITTEVLTKTLAKFAEDESLIKAATQVKTFTQLLDTMKESVQSGWAQSWENIIGNKDEAAAFFTAINDGFGAIAGSSAEARNEMLSFWKDHGGRAAIIESLANAFSGLQSIVKPIGEAFREIFPAMTGARLVEISKGIRDLTANFKIGEETAANIKSTFKGFFAVLDIGKQALTALGSGLISVLTYLMPAGEGFLSFTGNIGDFLVALNEAIKSSNIFNIAIQKVGDFMKPIADGVRNGVKAIVETFKTFANVDLSGLDTFAEKVKARFAPFSGLGTFVGSAFSKIAEAVQKVAPIFYKLASIIGGAFDKLRTNIVDALDNVEFNSIFDMINGGLFAAILLGLQKFIGSLTDITDGAGGFLEGITGILDGVKGSLEAYQSTLKAKTLLTIAIAIGILAASLIALSTIDSAKLTTSLAAMSVMFVELFGSMAIFEKIMGSSGFKSMGKITLAMLGMSIAILILSKAMVNLSTLDWNGIAKGLTAVAALALILVGSSKLLESSSGRLIRGSLGFILFAAAINILAKAVEKLGALDPASLAKGLIGVGVLAAELALFMKATDMNKMGVLKGAGILILAVAINVLATAVTKFGNLDSGTIIKGVSALTGVLAAVAIFVNVTGDSKRVISTAIGLTILGAAMLIFATAIGNMGNLSWEQIGKGLVTMGGALAIVAIALNVMPKNMILTGAGLVIVASALLILAKALQSMGGMTWDEIAKGLVTLAGSLTIIAIAMTLMTGALPGAAALLVVAASLAILAPVLKMLGSMALSEIGIGLLALAGVFAVIGVAGLLLAPLIPVLLGLGAAMALFGVAVLAIGAGTLAFSAGLASLAVAGTAGAAALVLIVTSLTALIPFVLTTLAQGLVDFAKVIGQGAPVIAEATIAVITAIISSLVKITPIIVDGIMVLLMLILDTLVKYVPKIVDAGMKIVLGFLKGISDNIKQVVVTAIQIMVNFIDGIASMLPAVIQSGVNLIISFINGLADAIRGNTDTMISAIKNLMSAIIEAGIKVLKASISGFMDVGSKIINSGLIQGIKSKVIAFTSSLKNLATDGIKALAEKVTGFTSAGKNVVDGFIGGIKSKITEAADWAAKLAKSTLDSAKAVLGIHSPSKAFKEEVGEMVGLGMAAGIKSKAKEAKNASSDMAKDVVEAAKKWIDDRKYYNKISLEEELYIWQEIQKKYKQGTEERIAADKEAYRIKNELDQAGYKHSVDWINDRKYYNELSLKEELAAWERVQKRYTVGTEERKNADKEVYRLRKEINDKLKALEDDYYAKTKSVNDKLISDIKSLNDEYDNALKSRTDALYKAYGLFDKVSADDPVSGQDLLGNLEGQITALDDWQRDLNSLSTKGISEELLKELQEMGPKSAAQIKALNTLSGPELERYASLWQTKHNLARTQAVDELEGLREDTREKISAITEESRTELEELRRTWETQMRELNANTSTQLTTLKNDTQQKFMDLVRNVSLIDWLTIGVNMVRGIVSGVNSQSSSLTSTVTSVAQLALRAAKAALGIHSPSTEFAKIGEFADRGLANGLKKFAGLVGAEGTNVGRTAINSLKGTLSNIAELVNGDLDMAPTIRPVLDLTNINGGLTSVFGKDQRINVLPEGIKNVIPNIANAVGRGVDAAGQILNNTANTYTGGDIIVNIYNPKIADKSDVTTISRQIHQQITGNIRAAGGVYNG